MVLNVRTAVLAALGSCLAATGLTVAGEWHAWRGPHQNGVSDETGLVSSWSPDGENLIWKVDFIGRSTPVVYDGQACVMGRTGFGLDFVPRCCDLCFPGRARLPCCFPSARRPPARQAQGGRPMRPGSL